MKHSGIGLSIQDLRDNTGQVMVSVEDVTEYSQTNTTYVEKKRWVDEITVPADEVWVLESLVCTQEQKATASNSVFNVLVNDIIVSSANMKTGTSYSATEFLEDPPDNIVILVPGDYDVSMELKVQTNAGNTAYIKNQVHYFNFRRYRKMA